MNFKMYAPMVKRELNKMSDEEYKKARSIIIEIMRGEDSERGLK